MTTTNQLYKRQMCVSQSYYVYLDVAGVDMKILVQVENQLELSRCEIIERALSQVTNLPRLQALELVAEDVQSIEVFEKKYLPATKHYSTQSYMVKFDTNTPVDVNVNVYHDGNIIPKLTGEEILAEALDYLEDINITGFSASDHYEIETLELKEVPAPINFSKQDQVLEDGAFVELAVN